MQFYLAGRGRQDLHATLVNLLLPLCVIISSSLVISHAKAVEHVRTDRGFSRKQIHVSVKPRTTLEFYPGGEVIVACKANGGKRIQETPFIKFFRVLDDETHMPLNSGNPGITLQNIADYSNEYRVKQVIMLTKNFYHFLEKGENLFYCKANDMTGNSGLTYFVIHKKSYSGNPPIRERRHRRRRIRHRSESKK